MKTIELKKNWIRVILFIKSSSRALAELLRTYLLKSNLSRGKQKLLKRDCLFFCILFCIVAKITEWLHWKTYHLDFWQLTKTCFRYRQLQQMDNLWVPSEHLKCFFQFSEKSWKSKRGNWNQQARFDNLFGSFRSLCAYWPVLHL